MKGGEKVEVGHKVVGEVKNMVEEKVVVEGKVVEEEKIKEEAEGEIAITSILMTDLVNTPTPTFRQAVVEATAGGEAIKTSTIKATRVLSMAGVEPIKRSIN